MEAANAKLGPTQRGGPSACGRRSASDASLVRQSATAATRIAGYQPLRRPLVGLGGQPIPDPFMGS